MGLIINPLWKLIRIKGFKNSKNQSQDQTEGNIKNIKKKKRLKQGSKVPLQIKN